MIDPRSEDTPSLAELLLAGIVCRVELHRLAKPRRDDYLVTSIAAVNVGVCVLPWARPRRQLSSATP